MRFDDNINDLDFFSKFKYTTKGGIRPCKTPLIAGTSHVDNQQRSPIRKRSTTIERVSNEKYIRE